MPRGAAREAAEDVAAADHERQLAAEPRARRAARPRSRPSTVGIDAVAGRPGERLPAELQEDAAVAPGAGGAGAGLRLRARLQRGSPCRPAAARPSPELEAREAADGHVLPEPDDRLLDDLLHRPVALLDEGLLEQADVLVEPLDLPVDDALDDLRRACRCCSRLRPVDLALGLELAAGHLVAAHVARRWRPRPAWRGRARAAGTRPSWRRSRSRSSPRSRTPILPPGWM